MMASPLPVEFGRVALAAFGRANKIVSGEGES